MIDQIRDRIRVFLRSRSFAYRQVFAPSNVYTSAVLQDLNKFCRGTTTTAHANSEMSLILQGRREVLLRILDHTKLSIDDLYRIYAGPEVPTAKE